ncbi:MAG: hypothetical protein ABI479_02395, partial [Gallionella sp.]
MADVEVGTADAITDFPDIPSVLRHCCEPRGYALPPTQSKAIPFAAGPCYPYELASKKQTSWRI